MSIPKTPVEFDYDLWTTEEGKCMVRIKATGEITEVERSVMQVLRSEEKRLRRTISPEQGPSREGKTAPTVLSGYDRGTDAAEKAAGRARGTTGPLR